MAVDFIDAVDPVEGPPITPTNPPSAILDLDIIAAAPVVGIGDGGNTLDALSDGFIHVGLSAATNGDGTLGPAGTAVDLTVYPVWMAVVHASPSPGDFLPADWLVRAGQAPCTYARLAAGPENGLSLLPGSYYVYVKIVIGTEAVVERAGLLSVVA